MNAPRSTPFAQPVDYEEGFVRDDRPDLYASLLAMPSARAGQPPARAALRRLGYAAPIAIAVFCVVWFGLQLLRGVL